ncbi:MAG: hypothetical protein IKV40_00305, partial [Clostridia bacterium]|nr:hypothetical protein [Clostridia bacterium]
MLKKTMRSALALVLVFAMLLGMCSTILAVGAEEHKYNKLMQDIEELLAQLESTGSDKKVNYVALGASNTNGYGLTGYLPEEVHEDPLAATKAGMNSYGYNRAPAGGYPYKIAEVLAKLADSTVEADPDYNGALEDGQPFEGVVNLSQLAISSMRVEEVRYLLDESMDADAYMEWRFT